MFRADELKDILITLDKLANDFTVYPDETKAIDKAIWCVNIVQNILQAGTEGKKSDIYIGGRLFEIRELAQ